MSDRPKGFEVVETDKDDMGEYVKVWDGGRDKKGHREGIHSFYVPGAIADFPVGRRIEWSIRLLPEEPKTE